MKNGLALTLIFFIIVSTASAELTQQGSRPTAQGTQQDSQNDHNIAKVDGNVTIGITLKEHNEFLKQREAEISQELAQANRKDKTTLEKQRLDVKTALRDVKASYEKHIAFLQAWIVDLEKLKGDFPGAILKAAKQALANGDEAKIDDLFRNEEERAEVPIRYAAEAAYQRGLLAEEQIRYQAAYDHFVRAADLVKDISRYPLSAGNVANTLALYDKAIVFYEQALASDLQTFGEEHPSVAKTRYNLGSVWDDKGDYDQAIGYYEQALASDLQTFGEDHPSVAKTRNNLSKARAKK